MRTVSTNSVAICQSVYRRNILRACVEKVLTAGTLELTALYVARKLSDLGVFKPLIYCIGLRRLSEAEISKGGDK